MSKGTVPPSRGPYFDYLLQKHRLVPPSRGPAVSSKLDWVRTAGVEAPKILRSLPEHGHKCYRQLGAVSCRQLASAHRELEKIPTIREKSKAALAVQAAHFHTALALNVKVPSSGRQ